MSEEITHELIKRQMDIIKGDFIGDQEYAANCLNAVGVVLANKYLDEHDKKELWKNRCDKWIYANQKLSDLNQSLRDIVDRQRSALNNHHQWHLDADIDVDVGLGDGTTFNLAESYLESSLYEQTIDALKE